MEEDIIVKNKLKKLLKVENDPYANGMFWGMMLIIIFISIVSLIGIYILSGIKAIIALLIVVFCLLIIFGAVAGIALLINRFVFSKD